MAYNNRQEANKKILAEITELVENEPDLRFHQILHIIGVTELDISEFQGQFESRSSSDKFGEESVATLKRVEDIKGDNIE